MFSGCGFAGDAAVRTIVANLRLLFDGLGGAHVIVPSFSQDFGRFFPKFDRSWKIFLFIEGKF